MSTFYPNRDVVGRVIQMFVTPTRHAPDAVYLAFYVLAGLLALFRFQWAPGLAPLLLHCGVQIAAFSARLYHVDNAVSLETVRAIQALLCIAYILQAYQLVILKAEHFNVDPLEIPSMAYIVHRYRRFTHIFFLPLLLAAFVLAIVYAALLGSSGGNVRDIFHAFVIVLLVVEGLFILFLLFTPFWIRAIRAATGMWILVLALILLIPPIYLEFRYQGGTEWVHNSIGAFYTLWCLPQAIVTIGVLMVPLAWWYPLSSKWIL